MSLPKFYAKQFRQQMLCHPVWLPGDGRVPGDIGVMHDDVFKREGSYADYTRVKAVIVEEDIPAAGKSKLSNGVSLSLGLGAQASINPAAKIGGKLEIKSGGGVLLHVPTQRRRSISNLREVLNSLPWGTDKFGEDTVFVAEVRLAKAIALVLSDGADTSIELTGKALAVQSLDIADASISFGSTSAASYTTSVGDPQGQAFYPFGVLLYRANESWLRGRKIEPLEAGTPADDDGVEPFEEISPYDNP